MPKLSKKPTASKSHLSRDARIDWSGEVRVISVYSDGSAVRPSGPGSNRDWEFDVVSPNFGEAHGHGINEGAFLKTEAVFNRPTLLRHQPESITYEIDGHFVRHVPDFEGIVGDRPPYIVEVKGASAYLKKPWLDLQLDATRRAYTSIDRIYRVVKAAAWRRDIINCNATAIFCERNRECDPEHAETILKALSEGPARLGDLRRLLPNGFVGPLYRLHLVRSITIDLSQRLSDHSIVIPGGTAGILFWEEEHAGDA